MARKKESAGNKRDKTTTGTGNGISNSDARDEIDFPTLGWSLALLAALVAIHRLIWGG